MKTTFFIGAIIISILLVFHAINQLFTGAVESSVYAWAALVGMTVILINKKKITLIDVMWSIGLAGLLLVLTGYVIMGYQGY